MIQASRACFSLSFAVCNDANLRDYLIQRIRASLSAGEAPKRAAGWTPSPLGEGWGEGKREDSAGRVNRVEPAKLLCTGPWLRYTTGSVLTMVR